jgi:hypothetical protein
MAITRLNNNSITSITALPSAVPTGITEADQWRITGNVTVSGATDTTLTGTWERADSDNFGVKGTGLTESSGIFTFPSSGYYFVIAKANWYSTDFARYCFIQITMSFNSGSNWSGVSRGTASIHDNSSYTIHAVAIANSIIKVSDASTARMKFIVNPENSAGIEGDTNQMSTGFDCIKLGDI